MAPARNPAVERIALETADVEQANAWLQQMYCGHVLHDDPDPLGIGLRITGSRTDRLRIETIRSAAPVTTSGGPGRPLGAIQVRRGTATASTSRFTVALSDRAWGVLDTSRPVRVVAEANVLVRVVVIDPAELSAVLGQLLDRPGRPGSTREPGAAFPLAVPLDWYHARYWNDAVDRVEYDLLSSEELMSNPLIRHEAGRALATGMLITFPNSALAALHDPLTTGPGSGEPSAVRRAVAYIDDHAGEPIDDDDVATAARTTVPDLRSMFRRHRDTTPREYLQRVRMNRAHRDLQAGAPDEGDTVATIAARWGFADLDGFTAGYRLRYGRSPSESLHR